MSARQAEGVELEKLEFRNLNCKILPCELGVCAVNSDSEYSRKAAKHVLSEVEGLAEVNLILNRACPSLVIVS